MAFPENFISELIERNDIVSVVSDYVRLTKRSGSNMFGLCRRSLCRRTSSFITASAAARAAG